MDIWSEKVNNSVAVNKAQVLHEELSKLDLKKYTVDERNYLDRMQLIIDVVTAHIKLNDPRLINDTALTAIGSAFANAESYFQSWIQGSGSEYLSVHIQAQLDVALSQLAVLAPTTDVPITREIITSLRQSVARYRTTIDNLMADLQTKASATDISIDEKVRQANLDFEKIKEDTAELESTLVDIKNSSAQLSTEQITAFSKAEAVRSTTFNKLVADKQRELNEALKNLSLNSANAVKLIEKRVKADETKVSEAKVRVEALLGIVGEEALIGDYSKNVVIEREAADRWRIIAARAFIAAIFVALIFTFITNGTTPWQQVVAKALIVVGIGTFAGYATRQSSEHRHAQRDTESMALQLKAVRPYLEGIDDKPSRDGLLIQIANRLFGQKRSTPKGQEKAQNPVLTAQFLQDFRELIEELLKRNKDG